jgi:FkbM family methyltransferase
MLRSVVKRNVVRLFPRFWVRYVLDRSWVEPEIAFLKDVVPRNRISVDVGANIGAYTRQLAVLTPTVHAFEPTPDAVVLLRASSGPNVIIHECALSDYIGEGVMHVPVSANGERHTPLASLVAHGARNSGDHVSISVRTLDSFSLQNVGFVKIDVEGHELPVLRGGIQTVRRDRPTLLIECEERHNPGGIEHLKQYFNNLNYAGKFVQGGRLHDLDSFDPAIHQREVRTERYIYNFFFLPE